MLTQRSPSRRGRRRRTSVLALSAVAGILAVAAAIPARAQTLTTLHAFADSPDGAYPFGGLVADLKGNYYGTTQAGGTNGEGAVFELSPPSEPGGDWTESVIYSFVGGTDGLDPSFQMVIDSKGNLYGETEAGGDSSCGCGTVFKLVPPTAPGAQWTKRTLYSLTSGSQPYGGLIVDSKGALYGTTITGGKFGYGQAFRVAPSSAGGYTATTIYSFGASGTDSQQPFGPVTVDSSGNLYGVSSFGGVHDDGTVYKLARPAEGTGPWTNTVLYSFPGSSAGCTPQGNVILDGLGNLYGQATACGGNADLGVIFQLKPTGSGWTESVLHSFSATDGGGQFPSLIFEAKKNLFYGTSFSYADADGGVVFQLKPPGRGSRAWTETVIYTFTGGSDGAEPLGPLVLDANGLLYGTAYFGGSGYGTVFSIIP